MPDQQYYENLYKPKNTGSYQTPGVTSGTISYSPQTPTSSSVPDSVQQRIEHDQLDALRSAVKKSKHQYENDVDFIDERIASVSTLSPITSSLYENLNPKLSNGDYYDAYDNVIRRINDVL